MRNLDKRLGALEHEAVLLVAHNVSNHGGRPFDELRREFDEVLASEEPECTQDEQIASFRASLARMSIQQSTALGS